MTVYEIVFNDIDCKYKVVELGNAKGTCFSSEDTVCEAVAHADSIFFDENDRLGLSERIQEIIKEEIGDEERAIDSFIEQYCINVGQVCL